MLDGEEAHKHGVLLRDPIFHIHVLGKLKLADQKPLQTGESARKVLEPTSSISLIYPFKKSRKSFDRIPVCFVEASMIE